MAAIRFLVCCVVLGAITGVFSCNERAVEVCEEKFKFETKRAYSMAENTTNYEPACTSVNDWRKCVEPASVNCTVATTKPFDDMWMKLKKEPSSCKPSSGASIAASLGTIVVAMLYTLVLRK